MLEDTKGVIRSFKSKKNRQHNGQKNKYKRTDNDLQNTARIERHEPHLKLWVISGAPDGKVLPALVVAHVLLLLLQIR